MQNNQAIKTVDITTKFWFDKTCGNTYFASRIILNYGMQDEKTIKLPFQYGSGSQPEFEAVKALKSANIISNESSTSLWRVCEGLKIILRSNQYSKCLKRDVKEYGII